MQVERDYGRWQLPQNLEALSEGGSYPGILREWNLDYVEHLAPGEDSETCLCTHHPIREVCHIVNLQNAQTAIVGNCCIKKFEKEEAGAINFGGTHKVFDALKRIEKDENAKANQELLDYAFSKKILTQQEYDKYSELWRNRTFYDSELRLMRNANRKIINHVNSKAMKEFNAAGKKEGAGPKQPRVQQPAVQQTPSRTWAQLPVPPMGPAIQNRTPAAVRATMDPRAPSISVSPQTNPSSLPTAVIPSSVASQQSVEAVSTPIAPAIGLAQHLAQLRFNKDRVTNMSLVRTAHEQRILTDKEFGFYEQIVQGSGRYALSPSQQSWLTSLNKKIIDKLELNPTPVRGAPQPTPTSLKLARRESIEKAFSNGLIKEKDKTFYLSLVNQKPTTLSESQQKWVADIHKRIRFEDEQTEANSNPRPTKRALVME